MNGFSYVKLMKSVRSVCKCHDQPFVLPLFQARPIQRPPAVIQLIVPANRRSKHVLELCLSCFENALSMLVKCIIGLNLSGLLHLLSALALINWKRCLKKRFGESRQYATTTGRWAAKSGNIILLYYKITIKNRKMTNFGYMIRRNHTHRLILECPLERKITIEEGQERNG